MAAVQFSVKASVLFCGAVSAIFLTFACKKEEKSAVKDIDYQSIQVNALGEETTVYKRAYLNGKNVCWVKCKKELDTFGPSDTLRGCEVRVTPFKAGPGTESYETLLTRHLNAAIANIPADQRGAAEIRLKEAKNTFMNNIARTKTTIVKPTDDPLITAFLQAYDEVFASNSAITSVKTDGLGGVLPQNPDVANEIFSCKKNHSNQNGVAEEKPKVKPAVQNSSSSSKEQLNPNCSTTYCSSSACCYPMNCVTKLDVNAIGVSGDDYPLRRICE